MADRNIRFQAELGGKNATVVLADADLAAAVEGVVAAGFGQASERCTATSRVILDRTIHDGVVALLTERLPAVRTGRPDVDGTTMGPLVSASHESTCSPRSRPPERKARRCSPAEDPRAGTSPEGA